MSEINLSNSVRTSLSSLQATADLLSDTQERLATGNRINSALDDPSAFFTAAALNDRASDLSTLLDAQQQSIQVVEAADEGISAIQDLVNQARSVAEQALGTDNQSDRAAFARQFDDLLGQIETLAGDSSFNGINLLDSENSADLTVVFNESNTASLTVQGVNFTDVSAVLGLDRVAASNNANPTSGTTTNAQTQTEATNFNTTDTFTFSVGNSNGTETDFSVTFDDTDAADAVAANAVLTASDFNTSDTFNINGPDGIASFNFVDNDTVSGTVTAANGSGTGEIDIASLAAGDTIELADGNGDSFTFTVGASIPSDNAELAAQINQAGIDAGVTTVTASADSGGGVTFTSTVGQASFTSTDVSAIPAARTAATTTLGAGTNANPSVLDVDQGTTGANQLDFSTLAAGDELTIELANGDTSTLIVDEQLVSDIADEILAGTDAGNAAVATAFQAQVTADGLSGVSIGNDGANDGLNFSSAGAPADFQITAVTFVDASAVDAATQETGTSTNFQANENETDGLSAQDVVDQINADTANTGITASLDPQNTDNIVLTSTPANAADDATDFTVTNATQSSTVVDTSVASANTTQFTAAVANGLSSDEITAQINAAAEAAGLDVAGGALTVGSSTSGVPPVTSITFSSDTGNIGITSNNATPLSVSSTDDSVDTNTSFVAGNGAGSDFSTIDSINQTLQAIDDALGTLRSTATSLGSDLSTIQIRSDFTSNLINTLEVGAGNLTLADLNEEGANLLTLQTRQQLASTSLSFATQADQSVLSLF